MPIDPRRREQITAAVAAHDAPLPRNAVLLLAIMFPSGDMCHQSLDTIAAEGVSRKNLPATLRRLVEAGFLSRERGSARIPDTYRLHLPVRP